MEAETTQSIKQPRVWGIWQIGLASFFTGPLGGCYLLSRNYHAFGENVRAKKALLIGIIGTLILSLISMLIPEEFTAHIFRLVPILYTMSIYTYAKYKQSAAIAELLKTGGKKQSFFKFILIVIGMLLIELPVIFGIGCLLDCVL